MTKKELLQYEKFFITNKVILKIFKDEDEIPIEIIQLMFHIPKPIDYKMLVGKKTIKEINKLIIEEYGNSRNKSKKL